MRRKLDFIMITVLLAGLVVMVVGPSGQGDAYTRDVAVVNDQLEEKLAEAASILERTEADLAWERSLRDGEVSGFQSQTADLTTQKAKLQAERDDLAERAEGFMAQVDAARLDLDGVAKQLFSAGDRARDLEGLLKKREERVKSLGAELDQTLLDLKAREDKIALLETLIDRQNEKVVALKAEQDQTLLDLKAKAIETDRLAALLEAQDKKLTAEQEHFLQEKTDLEARVAGLSGQIESMKNERSQPSWKSDRQEKEIAAFSGLLLRVAAEQKSSLYRLIPVCFSASDLPQCPDDLVLAISMAMVESQAWYYSYVGKTFEWNAAVAMQGERSFAWYDRPEEIYGGNLRGGAWTRAVPEVASRLPQTGGNFIYLVFFVGWKSEVAVALGGDERFVGFRFGFFGNTTVSNLSDKTPEGRQLAVGTVSHEIGHALGILEHSPSPETVLGTSANIFGGFSEEQLRFLQNSSFLR